jgi:branched-chain amino acid transport system substrate-binding protein
MKARLLNRLLVLALVVSVFTSVASTGVRSALAADGPVDITALTALSGPGEPYGTSMTHGAQLAIDEINRSGGMRGKQVALKALDDGSNAATGVTLIQKLVGNQGVVLMHTLSSVVQQVAPVANENQTPLIGPVISAAKILMDNRPYVFTDFPRLSAGAPQVLAAWKKAAKITNVSMIVDAQNAATSSQAAVFSDALKASQTPVVQNVSVTTGDVDFGAAVQRALSGSPSGIIVSALPQQAGAIVRTIRSSQPDIPIFLTTASFVLQTLNMVAGEKNMHGTFSMAEFYGGKGAPASAQKFVADYKAKYNVAPDGSAAFAYEELMVLAQAAKAGAFTPGDASVDARNRLVHFLESLNWQGPFSHLVMTKDGIMQRDWYVIRVTAGGPELMTTVKP